METKILKIGNFSFDCLVSGKVENELVILLHGFPETSFMWRNLMNSLSSCGYYCLAPNMRGYSKEAAPKGVKNYTVSKISNDIQEIVKAVGKEKYHLIGHDWGAIIGWHIVFNNPNIILSWSALSVPHTSAFGKAYKLNKEQQKKSRYIKWFLLPFLPELWIRRNDFALLKRLWKHSAPEEVEGYLTVFRRRQSLTGALNYYRANIGKGKGERIGDIITPTLFIWGNRDLAIGRFAAESNGEYMRGEYTFLEVDGGHWLIQSNYAEVEDTVLKHIFNNSAKLPVA